jgi:hypothetical protein
MLRARGRGMEENCVGSGDKQFNADLVDGAGGDMKCPPPA